MLTKCPECELQVSDKALLCPHCGYPLKEQKSTNYKSKSNKRRRLPNGFGQITEIKKRNLRKPFRAMVTVAKTQTGKPICKPLKPNAYFETYNDAYTALLEYNKNSYDLSPSITVKELYEKWFEEYSPGKSDSRLRTVKCCWPYCTTLYSLRVVEIRVRHLKECIMNATAKNKKGEVVNATPIVKKNIKNILNMMFDYAVEQDMTDKNYARAFILPSNVNQEYNENKTNHISYTDEEMQKLWDHNGNLWAELILIQCYSGWRPQELLNLKIDDVDLNEMTLKGGMKTSAGKNRIVPIHPRIFPLIQKYYEKSLISKSSYLFTEGESILDIKYNRFLKYYHRIVEELGLNKEHRPHDGRKHFVTMAKRYGVDEYAIKYIVGHAITDLTEDVYTDRSIDWLKNEMTKIP